MNKNELLQCQYKNICSACPWIEIPFSLQLPNKAAALNAMLRLFEIKFNKDIELIATGSHEVRDRVDLTLSQSLPTLANSHSHRNQRLGFLSTPQSGSSLAEGEHGFEIRKEVVDIEICRQLSPALQKWLTEFRSIKWPISRGSLRLRVSPLGERGVWLDFANIDIKHLLESRTELAEAMQMAHVEIGQKRKSLVQKTEGLKLVDPVLRPWFETWSVLHSRPIPLYCTVGSFTQTGFLANRILVETVINLARDLGVQKFAEFGSGIGNFTLPLAEICTSVDAYEIDALALEGLRRSSTELGLEKNIVINQGDYQNSKRADALDFSSVDSIVVDPPRSGLKKFLSPLQRATAPEYFLYVSCFAESFCQDVKHLEQIGYRIESLKIVDQFPQSPHYELVSLLKLH